MQMLEKFYILFILIGILGLYQFAVSGFYEEARAQSITYSPVPYYDLMCKTPEMCLALETEESSSAISQAPAAGSDFCLNVPILLYHHIQPQSLAIEKKQTALSVDSGIFDAQMNYLKYSGYTAITAEDLVNALSSHGNLPAKSILITIDDGYKDNFLYAFPILQKYGLIGNFMVPSGLLGGEDFMTWDDLKQISSSGFAFVVNHTWSHFPLPQGSVEKIKMEAGIARSDLVRATGQKINTFAYPYGSFDDKSIAVLRSEGFTGAFSTINGTTQCESFIMSLHRTHIGNAPLSSYGL
ncbi:MAG: polysaccharide deacetylase family protein [Patescibacteria group bacterium]